MFSDAFPAPLRRAGLLTLGIVALAMPVTQALAAGPDAERIHQRALRYFTPLPDAMPGAENDTEARVQLGQMLFFDPRLSANDTQSCASCHLLGEGQFGMDNLAVSPGAFGDVGTRNSPTVLNAGFQASQFWDGRAHDLADQAGQPILNPIEMAMPDQQAVLDKLAGIENYPAAFAAAFPADATPLTYANLAEALSAFQRTLRSPSRFDDFLEGDLAALNEQELRGLDGFIRHNCVRCHDGALLGGVTFEKLGIYGDYPNQEDQGRFEVTGDEADRMVFKTSQLRNVARTGPWYHDGAVDTLDEAVRTMAELQLRRRISDEDIADMTVFLGALTDDSRE
jgi:cytochrome c peroxidase